jgi:hypothetical protein
MFESTSRYSTLSKQKILTADGRSVLYVRRRFLPQGKTLPLLRELSVKDGDRLDLITAKTLGDSEQFWRIGDANDAMQPQELVAEPGRRLLIPLPQV